MSNSEKEAEAMLTQLDNEFDGLMLQLNLLELRKKMLAINRLGD
jgi:hypothetical protein